jgi:septum formation protein
MTASTRSPTPRDLQGKEVPNLVLASASPRRADVLRALGLDFTVDPTEVPEVRRSGEPAEAFVERLAREKASAAAARHPSSLVLGGDTVVVLDGEMLGKPEHREAAVQMLLRLQGREHQVATGLALIGPEGIVSGVDLTTVRIRPFGAEVARAYVATGEPLDKAGAYGIQGRGGALVREIEGDYFTVMGFPVALFVDLLGRYGVRYAFGVLEPGTGGPGL